MLEDDKFLFPPYQIVPVVRQQALRSSPRLADTLNGLAPRLTDEVMRRLNYEVTTRKAQPADVARAFLVEKRLILK